MTFVITTKITAVHWLNRIFFFSCNFSKESICDTCFCSFLKILQKCDIVLLLNRLITCTGSYLDGCFLQNVTLISHILQFSLISLEVRVLTPFPPPSPQIRSLLWPVAFGRSSWAMRASHWVSGYDMTFSVSIALSSENWLEMFASCEIQNKLLAIWGFVVFVKGAGVSGLTVWRFRSTVGPNAVGLWQGKQTVAHEYDKSTCSPGYCSREAKRKGGAGILAPPRAHAGHKCLPLGSLPKGSPVS